MRKTYCDICGEETRWDGRIFILAGSFNIIGNITFNHIRPETTITEELHVPGDICRKCFVRMLTENKRFKFA